MSDFFTNPVVQTLLGLGVCFVLASGLMFFSDFTGVVPVEGHIRLHKECAKERCL